VIRFPPGSIFWTQHIGTMAFFFIQPPPGEGKVSLSCRTDGLIQPSFYRSATIAGTAITTILAPRPLIATVAHWNATGDR
jgi:hypothetical protein